MTGITDVCRVDMVHTFTRCYHAIVTAHAGTDNLAVINVCSCYRRPGCGSWCVTGFAGIAGIDMCRALARRYDTIMATDTGAIYLRMINRNDWRPGGS